MTSLREQLLHGEKWIGVWGTGYIGYSTMASFAYNGVRCLGTDVAQEKVDMINKGLVPVENLDKWLSFDVKPLAASGTLRATSDWRELIRPEVAVHMIAIPTEKDGAPYDAILEDVIRKITHLKDISAEAPPLVIIESTLTPGRTDRTVIPILEEAGLEAGKDILLGVAPRRDWFISADKNLKNLPRIIGGTNKESTDRMREALSIVCDTLLPAPDHRHAEMIKSIENAFRHADITLANQLSLAYPHIDMETVLKLVGTKWNIGTYWPSFGTGGYCIPLSSQYVLLGAEKPEELTILRSAIETDKRQPSLVADSVLGKGFRRIGILGLAYKGDLKVDILSPAVAIAKRLREKGATVKINDPYYTGEEILRITGCESFQFPGGLEEFDCVLLVADHSIYRSAQKGALLSSMRNCRLVLDNTGIWKGVDFSRNGTQYHVAGDRGWLA
jgi:nucleotide sugar dehydrogenase